MERVSKLIQKKIIPAHGWRKLKSIKQDFKSLQRSTAWAVFKGKKDDYKRTKVKEYLTQARVVEMKVNDVLKNNRDSELTKYSNYITLFTDQITRRLLKGETIPADEKVFSIFEEHTEWISKGKRSPELGNALLITSNQYHLILDYKIMFKEKDASQILPLLDRLNAKYPNERIDSLSTDKGFYSKNNFESCINAGIKNTIMPKKGKCNKLEYAREHEETFIKLRNRHSAVESNINMLEQHGLNRCLDKGKPHFERYVSLSVLAYNLHVIGKELVHQKTEKEKRAQKQQHWQAA